jgi:uncharacterized protein
MSAPTSRWLIRLVDLLLTWRVALLSVTIAIAAAALGPASRLTLDQSIESLYSTENPRLAAWRESKRLFGGDEFVIVAYADSNLFGANDQLTKAAGDRIDHLSEKLRSIPGILPDSVQDLSSALRAPIGRSGIRRLLEGILVSADGRTTAIVCRLQREGESTVPRAETYKRIRQLAKQHDPPAVVVGEPIQVHDMFRYVEEDGATLGWASSVLLMVVIFLMFHSLRWMILPLLVVQIALIWTKGCLALSHMQLSMVSSMLNSLVTIIGIATVMHVTVRFREHRRTLDAAQSLRQTFIDLLVPIFWTIATTAAGFGSLLTSHIAPVSSFGIMMLLATMLVFVVVCLLLPGAILLGGAHTRPGTSSGEARVQAVLGRITDWVEHRPVAVSLGMVAVMSICSMGLFRLDIETDFSRNFRANSPIVRALNFFETSMGGAGTWEVSFPAPAEMTPDFLDRVRGLAAELRQLEQSSGQEGLTKVVALTDGLDVIPGFLPLSWRFSALDRMQPEFTSSLQNAEAGRMRIVLRAMERRPASVKLKLIGDVEAIARKWFPETRVTGLYVLLAHLIESLMQDQLKSFAISAGAIVVMMVIAYRSLSLGLVLLVPNVFPIVLVIGTVGWIGMPINIATAMIASVSMGLTVDSSIHYVSGYRMARANGMNRYAAIKETNQGVGLALVLANVALVAGFSVLTLSHFIPLVYFGVLVSAAMLGGLIGNLILLPLLLRFTDRA